METKATAGDALSRFVEDVGIPDIIVVDGASEQVGKNSEFMRTARHYKIQV
jgi:hypothetical protein